METLKEKLEEFANSKLLAFRDNSKDAEDKLQEEFNKLAPFFLSGGYIKVRDDYRVYPTTVEFYFHSEKENGIKDPIVYHRDNNMVQGKIPYFPTMTLHAHDSGYDITFENPKEEYRASILIREYQIWDIHNHCWLKWNTATQQFCPSEEKDTINTQVLYLKYVLNGFANGECSYIAWVDATNLLEINKGIKVGTTRQNVYYYNPNKLNQKWDDRNDHRYKTPRTRKWSFSRENPIE